MYALPPLPEAVAAGAAFTATLVSAGFVGAGFGALGTGFGVGAGVREAMTVVAAGWTTGAGGDATRLRGAADGDGDGIERMAISWPHPDPTTINAALSARPYVRIRHSRSGRRQQSATPGPPGSVQIDGVAIHDGRIA